MADKIVVLSAGSRNYLEIHPAKGLSLFQHIRSHGIICSTPNPSSMDVHCIELPRGCDLKAVQAILDRWKH
jgi:hypothetical protein